MLNRLFAICAAALLLTVPADAKFAFRVQGAVGSPPPAQTIASVPLSGSTFLPGSPSGTVVGTIGTPVMSPASPAFSGSCCTLSGTDQASFQIVGSNLETNGTPCPTGPCTFHINLVATQGGISNSPFSQAETITSSSSVGSLSFVNNGSGTSPGPVSTTPVHFLKTFPPGAVPVGDIAVPSVAGNPIVYGVDCAADGVNPLRSDGCPSWADGSLREVNVSAYIPQLTAGNTGQNVWAVQSGSYSTTSTIRPSDITSRSDYKAVLTNVNSSWVPQPYGVWPNGVQIGCNVSGGAVSGCTLRIVPPSAAGSGGTCLTQAATEPVGFMTGKIDNGSGAPGNILTLSAGSLIAQLGWLRGEIISDSGGAIAANTVATAQLTSTTYTVSGSPQLVASEPMGLIGCSGRVNSGVNGLGFTTPAIFTTTLGANGFPTAVNLVTGGSGYSLIGSGALTFDVNVLLNEYGSIDPPTCAAERGAGVFSSVTYSAGAVTVNTVTSGHIATGQILVDSTGATAVVTGTSSPWTVSGALTSGAMTANTPVCIHSASPVEKGYWIYGPYLDPGNSNAPDPQLMGSAEVDLWSNSGTPYSVRAIIRTDHEGWQPGHYFQSYTYNADIMNGTAEVRGNAQGAGIYTALTDEVPGDWWSADPALAGPVGASARMDWLGVVPNTYSEANSLAINSVDLYLASSDLAYWRSSRAMLPLDSSLTPTPTILPATTAGGSWDNPFQFQGYYMPFGPMFIDGPAAFGSGGVHTFLGPQGAGLSFWIDVQNKAADKGVSWLQQMRVAALALSGNYEGAAESDTGHALNVDPAFSNAAFTDPVRTNSEVNTVVQSSVPATNMAVGGQVNVHGQESPFPDTSHWPSGSLLGPYLVDGEYYQLKQMDLMSQLMLWSETDGAFRVLTFGGNTYHAVTWNTASTRAWAWGLQLPLQFTTHAPPAEPDVAYWSWVINHDSYLPYAAMYAFTGAWSTGSNSGNKAFDWTAAGGCGSPLPSKNAGTGPYSAGETTWMCAYAAQVLIEAQNWAEPGTNANLDLLVAEAADKYLVKNGSQNSCAFNSVNYTQVTGVSSTQAPNTSYDNTTISATPTGSLGQVYIGSPSSALTSTASSSTVTFTQPVGGNGPVGQPSGSTIIPTQWSGTNEVSGEPVPPSPLVQGTQYTWCSLSSTTGTINPLGTNCAAPAPITLATGTKFSVGWITNQPCPSGQGDWAFAGDFGANNSYPATFWAVYNWDKAVNGASADRNAAISLFSPFYSGNPGGVWTTLPNWDACTSFSC